MNLAEFRAWFDGFTENLDGPPGERAWKRIRERVAEIKEAPPVERHHFYDHYARPWYHYPIYQPRYGEVTCGGVVAGHHQGVLSQLGQNTSDGVVGVPFNSSGAFTALGRVEAQSLGSGPGGAL